MNSDVQERQLKVPRFGSLARIQQARFRESLSAAARSPTDEKGARHGHLIAHGHEAENLFPPLRLPGGALEFFRNRGIQWWANARSGDRTRDPADGGPTRNLASSQVSCVNFLLPLAVVPEALTTLLRAVDSDVVAVELIDDGKGNVAPVEFEWVGWRSPLEGGPITRGANQTSIDAVVIAKTHTGRRAYLLEWKYCEEYLRPENKGAGRPGKTRRARYEPLYGAGTSSFNGALSFEDLLFDPFYQLMRMLLLGDRILAEGFTATLQVDDFRVVVVCPAANHDYRLVVPSTPLGRRATPGTTVHDALRVGLKDPRRLGVVSQEVLVAALRSSPLRSALQPWLDYHARRYGW